MASGLARRACGDDIDGGVAVQGTTVYLPCLSGMIAVRASSSPAAIRMLWRSSAGGGPPVLAAGLVWTIGQNGELYGLDPTTGAVEEQASVGTPPTTSRPRQSGPDSSCPAAEHVVAFSARRPRRRPRHLRWTTSTTAARTPTTAPTTSTSAPSPQGGSHTGIIVAAVIGGVIVVGGLVWALVRRRRRR